MKHSSLVCLFGRNGSGKTRMLQRIEGLFSEGEVLRTGAETVMSSLVSGFAEHRSIDEICAPFLKAETLLIDNLWSI